MCPPCRERYRIYGNTKRAKWKYERETFEREMSTLRAAEDERRKAQGLGVRPPFTFRGARVTKASSPSPTTSTSCAHGRPPSSTRRCRYRQAARCPLMPPQARPRIPAPQATPGADHPRYPPPWFWLASTLPPRAHPSIALTRFRHIPFSLIPFRHACAPCRIVTRYYRAIIDINAASSIGCKIVTTVDSNARGRRKRNRWGQRCIWSHWLLQTRTVR
jgi:hypothetical protein